MLARREHSEKELSQKLQTRGFDSDDINSVITQLKEEGVQSDHRFTDSYVYERMGRGYGPLRIQQELRERGVSEHLIEQHLTKSDEEWMQHLTAVYEKKFGMSRPSSIREQAKQSRFLHYRGFPSNLIQHLFLASDQ